MTLLERAAIGLTVVIVCAAWAGVVLLLGLAQIHPYRPRTAVGWLVFVAGVPLAWILFETFGALLDREPMGRWVDRRTSNKRFSFVRILYLLVRTLLVLGLVLLTIWAGATYGPAL
jgi:uncharacterized membrane protein YdjX (TVP38/TMEM64 family)